MINQPLLFKTISMAGCVVAAAWIIAVIMCGVQAVIITQSIVFLAFPIKLLWGQHHVTCAIAMY